MGDVTETMATLKNSMSTENRRPLSQDEDTTDHQRMTSNLSPRLRNSSLMDCNPHQTGESIMMPMKAKIRRLNKLENDVSKKYLEYLQHRQQLNSQNNSAAEF